MTAIYDTIGIDYGSRRKADQRIAARIHAALGCAHTVLNVGAGTGNYEPLDRDVIALEPSSAMIAQRPPGAAPAIQGYAESLPFADNRFDAAMAVLTVHHWSDAAQGLREMRRVARGPIVILTFDPAFRESWLYDYIPALATLDEGQMPPLTAYATVLGDVTITPVPIPHDCTDGFLAANWRNPAAYLDPQVRAAISSFHKIGNVGGELDRLANDLASGAWARRYGELSALEQLDCGYRLVVAS